MNSTEQPIADPLGSEYADAKDMKSCLSGVKLPADIAKLSRKAEGDAS